MDFEAWTNRAVDRERRRRLLVGYVIGLLTVGSLGTALALTSGGRPPPQEEDEEVMEIDLAKKPPEPEPAEEVEPEPEPAEPEPAPAEPQNAMPELTTPTEVPDEVAEEKDVDESSNPYASGDPYKYAKQSGSARRTTGVAKKKVVKTAAPEPKPQKAPTGPLRVTSDTVPPKVLSAGPTSYPTAAKAAGIQGRVIVRFVVDTRGNPTQVRAIRGPEALRDACIASVKGTKYGPATRGGTAVAVYKNKVCNFRLK